MILNLKVVKILCKVTIVKTTRILYVLKRKVSGYPIGVLRAKNKLRPKGRILSATLRRVDDKFYVSLLFTDTNIKAYEGSEKVIGIDVGIKNTVTTSNGEIYNIPSKVFKLQKQIIKLQKKLSPTEKGWYNLISEIRTSKKKT